MNTRIDRFCRHAAFVAAALFVFTAVFMPTHAAELRLPAIFTDHAVLQQRADVPVWGWGEPGTEVRVTVAGQSRTATVGEDGKWRVDLGAMDAGGPHTLEVVSGGERLALRDILIGEVWLASGQSNMQWSIKNTDHYEQELAQCENDAIRFAMVFREFSPEPLDDLRGLTPWAACNADTLTGCCNGEGFSAVSYYFAKYLQAELGVPVGIINTSWGGTRIEPWTPPDGFERVPALADIAQTVRMNTPDSDAYQAMLRETIGKVEAWLPRAEKALEAGSFPPPLPSVASSSALNTHQSPTTLYNAMVHPLVPYANRGFLWYQGESNRGEGMVYRDKMEALIEGWRAVWQQDDLACYFVQLAPFRYGDRPRALPEIWEAQTAVLDIPHTGMAVINDIGDVKDIHPRNKDDVGHRLALLALNKSYGREGVVCDSPLFDRFEVENNQVRVYFKNARELKTRDGAAPTWFELSGTDGVYHAADARIDGATVVMAAEAVEEPVAVRFAWDHCAEPNLMNEAGLPASAFRAGGPPMDAAVLELVPEAKGLELVYAFDPTNLAMQDGAAVYDADNSANLSGKRIERVAYFLQLTGQDGNARWVYTEMDPFTQNLAHIGVPVPDKSAQFQQAVTNLFVKSNVSGLPTGELPEGGIEMWSCNYGPQAARGLAKASNQVYDFDDTMSMSVNPGHGCLQIHDTASGTTLLAFNNHRAGRTAGVGIGNCAGAHPDWTFSESAKEYARGKMLVLVKLAGK